MAVSLKVEERATRPRSIRNQLRHEGKVPAVVNGYKVESTLFHSTNVNFLNYYVRMVQILFSLSKSVEKSEYPIA